MACDYCEQKGYLIISQLGHNKEFTQAKMCPKCNDIEAYSNYVKNKYSRINQITPIVNPYQNSNVFPLKTEVANNILDLEEFRKRKKSTT